MAEMRHCYFLKAVCDICDPPIRAPSVAGLTELLTSRDQLMAKVKGQRSDGGQRLEGHGIHIL